MQRTTDFLLSQIVMLLHENICFSNKLHIPSVLKIYKEESKSKGKIHLMALKEVTVSKFAYHFST